MDTNEHLLTLCRTLINDPEIVSQPGWRKLILVGEVSDVHTGLGGYSFDAAGAWKAMAPSDNEVTRHLQALCDAMQATSPTGRPWLTCLLRISSDGEIGADFEYDDEDRWAVKPHNYEERIAKFAAMEV